MAHRPLDVADVEQPDLSEVDAREGVAHERVEAGLVDLHVEDAAPACRDERGLDVALELRHVSVDPRSVEDRPDDVELRVVARPGVDDPEADSLSPGSAVNGCETYWPA